MNLQNYIVHTHRLQRPLYDGKFRRRLNGGDNDSDMCGYLASADLSIAAAAGPEVHVLPVLVPMLAMVPVLLLLLSPRSPTRLGAGDDGRCDCGLSYPQLAAPSGWRLPRRSPATEPFRRRLPLCRQPLLDEPLRPRTWSSTSAAVSSNRKPLSASPRWPKVSAGQLTPPSVSAMLTTCDWSTVYFWVMAKIRWLRCVWWKLLYSMTSEIVVLAGEIAVMCTVTGIGLSYW